VDIFGNYGSRQGTLNYSSSITPDVATPSMLLNVTDTNNFTINNPVDQTTIGGAGTQFQTWQMRIVNASGGDVGTVTWGGNFKVGSPTFPGNGNSRWFYFVWDGFNNWLANESPGDL
jgi:hypothetical protein